MTVTHKQKRVNCPHCGTQCVYSVENPYRPFCSERCRLIDLGQWASESYKISAPSTPASQPDWQEE